MVVSCGACTALSPLLPTRHALTWSGFMLGFCGIFAGCVLTLPVQCCLRSLACQFCRFFGGNRLCNFLTSLLLPLVVPFFTQCCWTIRQMLRGGLKTFVGLSFNACALLAILCLLVSPIFPYWMPLVLCSCYMTACRILIILTCAALGLPLLLGL